MRRRLIATVITIAALAGAGAMTASATAAGPVAAAPASYYHA
jgi:hypothetical protein